jgi:hypothetical protein
MLAQIDPPSRSTKRKFSLVMAWFHKNWVQLAPFMQIIQLRDERMLPIDANRESVERHLVHSLIK